VPCQIRLSVFRLPELSITYKTEITSRSGFRENHTMPKCISVARPCPAQSGVFPLTQETASGFSSGAGPCPEHSPLEPRETRRTLRNASRGLARSGTCLAACDVARPTACPTWQQAANRGIECSTEAGPRGGPNRPRGSDNLPRGADLSTAAKIRLHAVVQRRRRESTGYPKLGNSHYGTRVCASPHGGTI